MKGLIPPLFGQSFSVKLIGKRSMICFAYLVGFSMAIANVPQSESSPGLLPEWEKFAGAQFTNRPTNLPLGTNVSFKAWRPLLKIGIENGNAWAEGFLGHIMLEEPEQPDDKQEGIKLLKKSAEKGCAQAMEELGWRYTEGRGVQADYPEAVRWLRPAAEMGLPLAQAELGYCCVMGLGVSTNFTEALKWFRLSAKQTNAFSMMQIGVLYSNGDGVMCDFTEATRWLTQAAELGNARAMCNLGAIAENNLHRPEEAFRWYKMSAERGDRFGCWRLAVCYYSGVGTVQEFTNFLFWATKSANRGVGEAQYFLGEAYRLGQGVIPDEKTSAAWYYSAATNNHADACFRTAMNLGCFNIAAPSSNREEAMRFMHSAAAAGHREAQLDCAFAHFGGFEGKTNFVEGQRWLKKSAEAEWPHSEYILALGFFYGQYALPKDHLEAAKWLRRAATHDWVDAQWMLGLMLAKGTDLPRDPIEAMKWFREAAKHGSPQGQNCLGYALETSETETPDLVEICKWYLLAARQNVPEAKINLSRVRAKLSEDQKAAAERGADIFHPLPVPPLPGVRPETPIKSQ